MKKPRSKAPKKPAAGKTSTKAPAKAAVEEIKVPAQHDWRTSDQDEINRRRLRAREEAFEIRNQDARFPIFSNFSVRSTSGMDYTVEVRDVAARQFSCDCADYRKNGLGTCKHAEAVLLHLEGRYRKELPLAAAQGSPRIEIIPEPERQSIRVTRGLPALPAAARRWFGADGVLEDATVEDALAALVKLRETDLPEIRIAQEVAPWVEACRRAEERKELRHEYEQRVHRGEWPVQETRVPLFPYQREGMLHLAFTERALLADEMGLGKTIQAIAACALLRRLGRAERVLVVTPASLKGEWEEQIRMFTDLPCRLVFGKQSARAEAYAASTFFTIVNYEQMLADALVVNARFRPDIVVLDEAQRIKNWSTKTAQAIKRLASRYAFVLTGTPIENRIDELYSLMDFLDPAALGPLFRFNREYYQLDERGRASGYRNLALLQTRIAPYMLRRRKSDVETELPRRTDRTHFVPLAPQQREHYAGHELEVARLASILKRRPLSPKEQEKMMRELAMMRMVCDTNYILDASDRECPKLAELESILAECRDNEGVKVIIFSEWTGMLELVREVCKKLGLGTAWHTGSVPQQRRRAEIRMFKDDPACRVFLSTDSGSTGLNLQVASVVINCDLPWNPAKLEQRIARAWRKHQTRAVTVINLVAENTIEHRMLETLANKQALADGVLDRRGDLADIKLRTGQQNLLAKLEQLVTPNLAKPAPSASALPADRPLGFAQAAARQLGVELLRCEERYPREGDHTVLLVVVEHAAQASRPTLEKLHAEYFADRSPLAPVQLEVMDRATHETIERLIAAGLIAPVTRAARPLFPAPEANLPAPLSAEEQQRLAGHLATAERKSKMAALLAGGGLTEEARPALLDAILALARAFAVKARVPEPASTSQIFSSAVASAFSVHSLVIGLFFSDEAAALPPVLDAVTGLLRSATKA